MMKRWGITVALVAMLVATAAAPAAAQEMSFRSGKVTDIVPIQVAAQQQATRTQPTRTGGALGRAMGRLAGRAAAQVGGGYSYDAYEVANGATQDTLAAASTGGGATGGPTTTAYIVMVRFDDGQESAIQQANASHLQKGGRVRVFGSGSGAQVVPQQ